MNWSALPVALVPPVVVTRSGRQAHVPVHVTDGDPVRVWLALDEETGGGRLELTQIDVYVEPRVVDGRRVGRATFTLPADLPLGWHELHAEGPSAGAHCAVVVTPDRLELPAALAGRHTWGYMAQLYSVRSRASWGRRENLRRQTSRICACQSTSASPRAFSISPRGRPRWLSSSRMRKGP